ncbi:zinc finger CCCH domain-containing protein 1 [Dorcoceras hygrometricum]|uniref:Zinc finger CCCH domain-containing protein 1 n=1 Tax=Dorcoceras hygrometricum TaxID=472368 RepID=A0A2Z7AMA8_9LAMI|nr:zinc finger CCCH domain-containing protein 1 [Dorcoceras hygrometricum]
MNKNLAVVPAGESSKQSGETDSENNFTAEDLQSLTNNPIEKAVEKAMEKKEAENKKKEKVFLGEETNSGLKPSRSSKLHLIRSLRCLSLCYKLQRRHRTERTKSVQKSAGDQAESNPGPAPEIPTEAEDVSTSAAPESNVEPTKAAEAQDVNKERSIVINTEPEQPDQQSMTFAGLEYVSSKMAEYDEWAHFRTEVRLNTITSMTPITNLAKIENELMPWAETELVSELLKWRMLVLYKMYEVELKKKVDEHRPNFDPARPSENNDHMCIRFLYHDLKKIAHEEEQPASEAEETARNEQQAQEQIEEISRIVQNVEETMAMNYQEYQAQEEEHQVQTDEQQAQEVQPAHEVERQAQAGSSHSSPTDFDAALELKSVKKVVESLDSKVDMVWDTQTYMNHDSDILRRAIYRKIDEVVTSMNTSQTALETSVVRQFTEHKLYISSDLDFVKMHLAELVNHFNEVSDSKKGKAKSSKKRRLLRGLRAGVDLFSCVYLILYLYKSFHC